ncbi:MAG: LytR C-terminal domain-containing protein [Candidatus Moraniibacteriota bacterium]|nr:MAG: LytR C-terminal domain-containing protein [Candidatus Moranbacteria bacterium]
MERNLKPRMDPLSGQESRSRRSSSRFSPAVLILTAALLAALGVAGYFYYQYRQSPKVQSVGEVKDLKEEIGAVFELPTDEEPTLATVTDRDKLAEQPFFQKAENGDKVLIYSASGRAILYRPSTKKIVDVTSVNVNQPAVPAPAAPVAEAVPVIVRVAILNGSTVAGATAAAEAKLKAALSNVAVTTKANAAKRTYTETIIVDVAGQHATAAADIAAALGGSVAGLPAGETAPSDADVLVIVTSGE